MQDARRNFTYWRRTLCNRRLRRSCRHASSGAFEKVWRLHKRVALHSCSPSNGELAVPCCEACQTGTSCRWSDCMKTIKTGRCGLKRVEVSANGQLLRAVKCPMRLTRGRAPAARGFGLDRTRFDRACHVSAGYAGYAPGQATGQPLEISSIALQKTLSLTSCPGALFPPGASSRSL